jgi:hypothetical protein
VRHDRSPGGVELTRRRTRAAPRDAVRLLDQGNGYALGERRLTRREQITGADAATGAVPQGQRRTRPVDFGQVCARRPVRSVDLERD